ncbi:MAG: hypothetical protein Q7J98_02220 [Kiritimatiellia bacterium]|nr:hypothetical protein [Kiritimatiellia bacterium]
MTAAKWLKHGVILFVLSFMFTTGENAFGQARKAKTSAAGKEGITVKKVEMTKVRTPDYSSNVSEATLTPGDWTKVLVRFDTEAEWTDQLEMRFYIVVKHPKTGAFTMFTGAYVYSDIPKGRNRQAAVFLRPRTVERYGVAERAAVEIYSKGEIVAMGSFPEGNKPWWRTATVRSVEGYVLDRSLTPFANIASDNYEIPKSK